MQRVLSGSGAVTSHQIANAVELAVASISNPTELNAVGTVVSDWRLCHTNVAGTDVSTLYRLDTSSASVSAPYVMASLTAGLRWVAVAGYACASDANFNGVVTGTGLKGTGLVDNRVAVVSGGSLIATSAALTWDGTTLGVTGASGILATGIITTKQPAAAGIQLDHNSATGSFVGSLSPSNLTANRRWTFPNADLVLSGSAAALTSGRIPFATTGGVLTDSANLTFSTTVLNIANTTAASASTIGSLTIGNGTAATNVGIGGGAVYAGASISGSGDNNPGSPNGSIVARNSTTVTKGVYLGVANAADWYFVQAADSAGPTFKDLQLNPSGKNVLIGTAAATGLGTNACLRVAGTTSASTPITGTIVVGDAATSATNVAIGGGNVVAGAAITATGIISAGGGFEATGGSFAQGKLYAQASLGTVLTAKTGSSYDFYLSDTAGNSVAFIPTGTRQFVVANGVASTSPTTGALQTIGGAGISGSLYASTRVGVLTASLNNSMFLLDSSVAGIQQGITFADNSAAKWIVYKNGSHGLFVYDAVNAHDCLQFAPGSVSAASVTVPMTTVSSSAITGALVIGTGTAATSVGIGGGVVYAGGQYVVKQSADSNASGMQFIRSATSDSQTLYMTASYGTLTDALVHYSSFAGAAVFGIGRDGALKSAAGLTVGSATMITTTTAFTNGAAAALGTLTNAPVAGNPTKWIPVNDNGTTRYMPAW